MKKQRSKPSKSEPDTLPPVITYDDRARSTAARINKHVRIHCKQKIENISTAHDHILPESYCFDFATSFNKISLQKDSIQKGNTWLFHSRKAPAAIKTGHNLTKRSCRHLPKRMVQFCTEFHVGYQKNFSHLSFWERPKETIEPAAFKNLIKRPKYLKRATIVEKVRKKPQIFHLALRYLSFCSGRLSIGQPPVITFEKVSKVREPRDVEFLNHLKRVLRYSVLCEKDLSENLFQRLGDIKLVKLFVIFAGDKSTEIFDSISKLSTLTSIKMLFGGCNISIETVFESLERMKALKSVKLYSLDPLLKIETFFEELNKSALNIQFKLAVQVNDRAFFSKLPKESSEGVVLKHKIKDMEHIIRSNLVTLTTKREAGKYALREVRGDMCDELREFLAEIHRYYPSTRELKVKSSSSYSSGYELIPFIEDLSKSAPHFTKLNKVCLSIETCRFHLKNYKAFLKSFELLADVTHLRIELVRRFFSEKTLPTKELADLLSNLNNLKTLDLKILNLREPFGSKFLARLILSLPNLEKFSFESSASEKNGRNIAQDLKRRRGVPSHEVSVELLEDIERTVIVFQKPQKSKYEGYYGYRKSQGFLHSLLFE